MLGLCGCSAGSSTTDASGVPDAPGTRNVAPNVYEVPGSVDFTISNQFSNDYLFSWSDAGGSFVDVPDPTLILRAGSSYGFRRTTSEHPLLITTLALPVQGEDGALVRTTVDAAAVAAAVVQPPEAFTADPPPADDAIRWTPSAAETGRYFYTCEVFLHVQMTGAIEVRSP
jgi:hypothetical protein